MRISSIRSALAAATLIAFAGPVHAQVYKVVDEDGNVTYTDQAPVDGSSPVDLPDLSVVETEPVEPLPSLVDEQNQDSDEELTPRELRRMYRDFAITRPEPEETFWGTGNQVVVSWNASNPLLPNMSVRLFVDGEARQETRQGMSALTLVRGEHTVYAELLDARGRRVVTTQPVTFFVKQHSRLFNQGRANPNSGP